MAPPGGYNHASDDESFPARCPRHQDSRVRRTLGMFSKHKDPTTSKLMKSGRTQFSTITARKAGSAKLRAKIRSAVQYQYWHKNQDWQHLANSWRGQCGSMLLRRSSKCSCPVPNKVCRRPHSVQRFSKMCVTALFLNMTCKVCSAS